MILCCTYLQPCCLYSAGPNIELWYKKGSRQCARATSQTHSVIGCQMLSLCTFLQAIQSASKTIKNKRKEGVWVEEGAPVLSALQLHLIALEYGGKSHFSSAVWRKITLDCSLKSRFTQIENKNLSLVVPRHIDDFDPLFHWQILWR